MTTNFLRRFPSRRFCCPINCSVINLASVVAIVAALAGCDTLNRIQYQIAESSTNAADRVLVIDVVRNAAATAGLIDRTSASNVPETLGFFAEPVDHFPTILRARAAGDLLVVDLSCFHPGPGKSKAYSAAEAILSTSLQRDFGARLNIVDDLNKQLPVR
jgi:hypothetical protein